MEKILSDTIRKLMALLLAIMLIAAAVLPFTVSAYAAETEEEEEGFDEDEDDDDDVSYIYPQYINSNDPSKGIYSEKHWQYDIPDDYTYVTSSDTAWSNGWYVADDTVNIAHSVKCSGNVNLILKAECDLTITSNAKNTAAINLMSGATLTIYTDTNNLDYVGKLTANAYQGNTSAGAAIGGASSNTKIIINGGDITAVGGKRGGAGIGGNYNKSTGTVIINGGYISASGGGNGGAGIGSGYYCTENKNNIIINGGNITAAGGNYGAGIGGGNNAAGGTITVTGGTVETTGGYKGGAGIGGGVEGNGGNITITGGTVEAYAGGKAAAIGGGSNESFGQINISGGKVTANGDSSGGIGMGCSFALGLWGNSIGKTDGKVAITGGDVSINIDAANPISSKNISLNNEMVVRFISPDGSYLEMDAAEVSDNLTILLTTTENIRVYSHEDFRGSVFSEQSTYFIITGAAIIAVAVIVVIIIAVNKKNKKKSEPAKVTEE